MRKIKLKVEGMQCASCAQIIEMRLREIGGIKSVSVSAKNKSADVEFDEKIISESKIKEVIIKSGYKIVE